MWQLFCHIWWFSHFFFFLTFDDFILTLCNSNITFDSTYIIIDGFLFFSHIWRFILTLYSTNITCDCTFITFNGSFIFFSHLTVLSSYYAVPILHETVLLSHLVIPLFFFLTFEDSIVALGYTNITSDYTFVTFSGSLFFSHIWQFPYRVILPYSLYFLGGTVPTSRQHIIPGYQILTFDGFIFILCSSNITYDSPFVKFGSSLIFSNIWRFYPHIVLFHHHIWQYFCHIW